MSTPTSPFAAPVSQAIALLQQGQWAAAEQVVAQILRLAPNEPDGLQLMGLVRAQQGRAAEAEKLYRRSLALRPKQPNVQINLAHLLAEDGRAAEAIALLRAAVRGEPNNADLLLMLAQLQQAVGEPAFAEKSLRAALKLRPGDPSAVMNLSGVLNMGERPEEAEPLLRGALAGQLAPGQRAALEHNLAVALKLQRRYPEALALFDAAIARDPNMPPTAFANRASTLAHLGRREEAVAGYREALARDPAHLAAQQELNALLYRMGRDGEFLASVDAALARMPEHPGLLVTKGMFEHRVARYAQAEDSYARAARVLPDNVAILNGLALARAAQGRFDEAVSACEAALKARPDTVQAAVNLAGILLQAGDETRALTFTERAVTADPTDQAAWAMHELALRLARDDRANALIDYERDVRVFDLDLPAGFNEELDAFLDTLHGDEREHIDQTLRNGTQTLDPIFRSDNPLVARLRGRIEEAVAAYIAGMAGGADHPLAGRRGKDFRFTGSWSSRLRDQGFHTNHIHPMGWISSCYYVAVPEAVADGQQGWIKFGEPSFATALNDPVRRAVKPAPGRLVLFPSYMWHGTVPFRSATARTTIAFDAVPA